MSLNPIRLRRQLNQVFVGQLLYALGYKIVCYFSAQLFSVQVWWWYHFV